MSKPDRPVHIMSPSILDAEEIPYDRSQMGPRSMILEIEFSGEEIDRLKAGTPRPVRADPMDQASLPGAGRR